MNDNIKRGIRTAVQAALGFLAAGALTQIWEHYNQTHDTVDPTLYLAVSLVLTAVAGWAVNAVEDLTGLALLAPTDRVIGDGVLRTGLGEKLVERGFAPVPGKDY